MFDFTLPDNLEWRIARIPKPGKPGEFRKLTIPNESLRVVQRQIYDVLKMDRALRPAPFAHGFIKFRGCRTAIDNIDPTSDVIIGLDVKDFFDTFPVSVVRANLLKSPELNEYVVDKILKCCTYNNTLPQGGPCSPFLTNIGMRDVDFMLSSYAEKRGFHYVRYADDIFLSQHWATPPSTKHPKYLREIHGVQTILREHLGLKLHWSKNHVMFRDGSTNRQVLGQVFGLCQDSRNAPHKMRRNARAITYNLAEKIKNQHGRVYPNDMATWRMLLGYARYMDCVRASGNENTFEDPKIQESHWNFLWDIFGSGPVELSRVADNETQLGETDVD